MRRVMYIRVPVWAALAFVVFVIFMLSIGCAHNPRIVIPEAIAEQDQQVVNMPVWTPPEVEIPAEPTLRICKWEPREAEIQPQDWVESLWRDLIDYIAYSRELRAKLEAVTEVPSGER